MSELSVGQVAARSGVPVSTIHFYESRGLIRSRRTSGNQRRYARDVLRRVAIIKVAQRTGLTLEAIRDAFATLPRDRAPTVADWRRLSAARSTPASPGWRACATSSKVASVAAAFRWRRVRCATPATSLPTTAPAHGFSSHRISAKELVRPAPAEQRVAPVA